MPVLRDVLGGKVSLSSAAQVQLADQLMLALYFTSPTVCSQLPDLGLGTKMSCVHLVQTTKQVAFG